MTDIVEQIQKLSKAIFECGDLTAKISHNLQQIENLSENNLVGNFKTSQTLDLFKSTLYSWSTNLDHITQPIKQKIVPLCKNFIENSRKMQNVKNL